MAFIGSAVMGLFSIVPDDVCYVAMPMFHSNALMAGWSPALAAGATVALPSRGRFSASGFLPDVRRYGVTYFNYVGKPLSYILATPEDPSDSDTTLRQRVRQRRRGSGRRTVRPSGSECPVVDGYGSTEGGAAISAHAGYPERVARHGDKRDHRRPGPPVSECPRAAFDERGTYQNAEEAIGEIVSTSGAAGFEGYWRNDEAETRPGAQRLVLDGGPRLPRRRRLRVLRRAHRRLAARRRGELRGGPGDPRSSNGTPTSFSPPSTPFPTR